MRGDKRERILRVLLNNSTLSKIEISRQAGCTRQWVIRFLRQLQAQGFVKDTTPIDKKRLLGYWIIIARKPAGFRDYMIKDPLDVLRRSNYEYALTTYQAENIIQHHLFPSRIDIHIKEKDMEAWHDILTKNGLYGKGNFRAIVSDEHVMYKKRVIDGLSIVSLPQLIVDLTVEGGPCKEAADMLLRRL
jgi:DNA-binding Lrp family transcriptional regulator